MKWANSSQRQRYKQPVHTTQHSPWPAMWAVQTGSRKSGHGGLPRSFQPLSFWGCHEVSSLLTAGTLHEIPPHHIPQSKGTNQPWTKTESKLPFPLRSVYYVKHQHLVIATQNWWIQGFPDTSNTTTRSHAPHCMWQTGIHYSLMRPHHPLAPLSTETSLCTA